jgi:hypothetical protein
VKETRVSGETTDQQQVTDKLYQILLYPSTPRHEPDLHSQNSLSVIKFIVKQLDIFKKVTAGRVVEKNK